MSVIVLQGRDAASYGNFGRSSGDFARVPEHSYIQEADGNRTEEGGAMTPIVVMARGLYEGAEMDRTRAARTVATYAGIFGIMLGSTLVILTLC